MVLNREPFTMASETGEPTLTFPPLPHNLCFCLSPSLYRLDLLLRFGFNDWLSILQP